MALKNVIRTDEIFAALQEHLNRSQQLAFVNAVVEAAQNKFTELSDQLQTAVANLQAELNAVKQKADILENFELGQVEEALKELLQNLDAEGLFDALCIEVGGTRYKLSSLISAIVSADKVVETKFNWNADGDEIQSVTLRLADGSSVTLNATKSDLQDADGNVIGVRYRFETNDWKGLFAFFEVDFQKITDTQNVLGQNVSLTTYNPLRKTNIVFDLNVETCTPATPESVTPDLNADGNIGTGEAGTT